MCNLASNLPATGNFKTKIEQNLVNMDSDSQITMVWYNEKIETKIGIYNDTSKIPGYICSYGGDKTKAEKVLEEYFENHNYDINIDDNYVEMVCEAW